MTVSINNKWLLTVLTNGDSALNNKYTTFRVDPWVNYRGFDSLAIETQLHATSHVFCFMCFLNQVLSLAVSQAKILSTPVYLLHGADLKF